MAGSSNVYANLFDQALSGAVNWASDAIKMALLSSSYVPNLATHVHFSDVSAVEVTGTGYTAGGVALASKTHTVTAANSWATVWAGTTAYAAGAIVIPATPNGFLYQAVNTGTSASTAPTFPTTVGQTVTSTTGLIWECLGESITQWASASPSWPASTIVANYAVIYDAQSGTTSTEPLIALINFGGNASSSASTLSVTCPTLGWFWLSPA